MAALPSNVSSLRTQRKHAYQFAVIAALIAFLRVPCVADALASVLKNVPGSVYRDKYQPGWFKPLSVQGWAAHLLTVPFGLEITVCLWKLHVHANKCTGSVVESDQNVGALFGHLRADRTYKVLATLFAVSQIQAVLTLLSHSMINVNDELEVSLIVVEFLLMRIHVFGAGLFLLFGWWQAVPVATLILNDQLVFDNVPGIVLSTLSVLVIFCLRDLPMSFKTGWSMLGFVPAVFPDTSNDTGHTLGAFGLNIPLAIMCLGLRGHVRQTLRSTRSPAETDPKAAIAER